MCEDEGFIKFYLNIAYQLSLREILDSVSDINLLLAQLKRHECITETEWKQFYCINNDKRKWELVKVLLAKNVDWKELGILDALNEADKKASDFAVVYVLEVFNTILDRTLKTDGFKNVDKWGPKLASEVVPSGDWLDQRCKKIAYHLILPDIVASFPSVRKFCEALLRDQVIGPLEWDTFVKSDICGVAYLLRDKDPKKVFSVLPKEKSGSAMEGNRRAYRFAFHKITWQVQTARSVAKYFLVGLAAIGLGVGAVMLAPVALAAAGFGAGGIAAGSAAAWFMSTYGGVVQAGSLCALLQSAGAAGIAASTSAGIGVGTGAASFGILSRIASFMKQWRHSTILKHMS